MPTLNLANLMTNLPTPAGQTGNSGSRRMVAHQAGPLPDRPDQQNGTEPLVGQVQVPAKKEVAIQVEGRANQPPADCPEQFNKLIEQLLESGRLTEEEAQALLAQADLQTVHPTCDPTGQQTPQTGIELEQAKVESQGIDDTKGALPDNLPPILRHRLTEPLAHPGRKRVAMTHTGLAGMPGWRANPLRPTPTVTQATEGTPQHVPGHKVTLPETGMNPAPASAGPTHPPTAQGAIGPADGLRSTAVPTVDANPNGQTHVQSVSAQGESNEQMPQQDPGPAPRQQTSKQEVAEQVAADPHEPAAPTDRSASSRSAAEFASATQHRQQTAHPSVSRSAESESTEPAHAHRASRQSTAGSQPLPSPSRESADVPPVQAFSPHPQSAKRADSQAGNGAETSAYLEPQRSSDSFAHQNPPSQTVRQSANVPAEDLPHATVRTTASTAADAPDAPAPQQTRAKNQSPSLAKAFGEAGEPRLAETVPTGLAHPDSPQNATASPVESAADWAATSISSTDAVARTDSASATAQEQPTQQTPLTDQIAARMTLADAREGKEVVVQMDPPELGKIHVTFRQQGGQLQGMIRVDNPETLSDLQREAPHLLARLQEAGIQIKTLDLQGGDLANQQQSDRGQQAQQAYSQFADGGAQGRGEQGGHSHESPVSAGPYAWADDPQGVDPPVGQYISETTLNVMM